MRCEFCLSEYKARALQGVLCEFGFAMSALASALQIRHQISVERLNNHPQEALSSTKHDSAAATNPGFCSLEPHAKECQHTSWRIDMQNRSNPTSRPKKTACKCCCGHDRTLSATAPIGRRSSQHDPDTLHYTDPRPTLRLTCCISNPQLLTNPHQLAVTSPVWC